MESNVTFRQVNMVHYRVEHELGLEHVFTCPPLLTNFIPNYYTLISSND